MMNGVIRHSRRGSHNHSLAWIIWVAASLAALSGSRNPLYLILLLLCIAFVGMIVNLQDDSAEIPIPILRVGTMIVVLSSIFNGLMMHYGETVLFVIPGQIYLISGIITLEAIFYGFLNGLVLAGFLAVFSILNQALPVQALVQLIPRAFYPVAVVVSIAITYVPVTLRQMQQIREAQMVRGYRWRGWRDWLALFMPLLVNGLERAMGLTEAMMARGFAADDLPDQENTPRLILGAGSIFLVGGWLMRTAGWLPGLGLVGVLTGLAAIFGILWLIGKRVPRTIYRQEKWMRRDWLITAGALITGFFFLFPIPGIDRASLNYYPYPRLTLPGFAPLLGLAALGLLGPGIVLVWQRLQRKRL